ncbi:MAG TPA: HU family DNA-binding protein [Gammaproteobacteria bacterium]|nr:HU family DNA-binding protein [Gammaproteobacteria bacterium]
MVRKTKPATKQRQGRNPMTGETITIAAKPKRDVIKVKPLKSLKDAIMQG